MKQVVRLPMNPLHWDHRAFQIRQSQPPSKIPVQCLQWTWTVLLLLHREARQTGIRQCKTLKRTEQELRTSELAFLGDGELCLPLLKWKEGVNKGVEAQFPNRDPKRQDIAFHFGLKGHTKAVKFRKPYAFVKICGCLPNLAALQNLAINPGR
ncbi:hypothetical protein [Mariniblastus fucicola]|uniref:hypothetical protein n=1 Tax=Mariniblastus fucicola TaxID=980251 RepID=UPI0012F90795|nr:hypothetical protein [Mariniblastus fucicola]